MSYFLNTYELDEVFPMTETVSLRYTLDEECPIDEYMDEYVRDGIYTNCVKQSDGTYVVIIDDVDETLIESLNPDDLAEFCSIEPEFVIAVEVI
jgi:hypothetical protein